MEEIKAIVAQTLENQGVLAKLRVREQADCRFADGQRISALISHIVRMEFI
jgi:hypothetical protein